MGDMILIKATQEVREVISFAEGCSDNEEGIYYTIADDGKAYTDDEFVTLSTSEEVDAATEKFMSDYKRGLLNLWKYGRK
jgi:hypothetical protein